MANVRFIKNGEYKWCRETIYDAYGILKKRQLVWEQFTDIYWQVIT